MKPIRLLLSMMLMLILATGCSEEEPSTEAAIADAESATSSPDAAIEAGAQALKNNDLNTLLAVMLPPAEVEKVRTEFEEERQNREVTDEERAEFAQTMDKLTAEGAEEKLMGELEPQLEQMAAQLPMMFAFGQMMASQSIEESQQLTAEQKQSAQEAMNALFTKLQQANLADKELARKAVDITVETARELELSTIDEAQALSFEQMLGKGGIVMGGVKEVMALYGFDINGMLDSVDASVESTGDEMAKVNISYDLFGTPQSLQTNMVEIDGRWYGEKLIEELNKPDDMVEDVMNMPAMEEPETVIASPDMDDMAEEMDEMADDMEEAVEEESDNME